MNKCPQCSNDLSAGVEVCRACGFSIAEDVTKTLSMLGLDETQATRILSDKSMTPEKWQKIKGLFEAAQDVLPEKRGRFLKNACGGDAGLKKEVEKLLGSFDEADGFMEKPAVVEAASLFENKKTPAARHTTGNLNDGKLVAGTVLASRYRIIGLLGKGGMGEVYRAEDLKLNQTVALKFLPDKLEKNTAALERFIGEVRTARQVSHPNVCRVFDIGEIDGKHFLSMEYIDGDDLSSLLRRIGRLPSDKAVEISRQICLGLHAIHDAGILHRDLKPANIIIDSRGKARITDFGIAGLEEDVSKEEIRVGTPAYMSPEQITGREVTQKSDIYSLGLLLYEIFTGKQVFQADSLDELIKKHQTTAPTNPSEFVENINPLVEKIINRCLEKNPADRPKSALQVALGLPGGNPLEAAIAAGETPSPEMVAAAPKKGALKPKVALLILVALLAGFIGMSVVHQRYKTYNIQPLEKSPEVLAENSREILEKIGYTENPADSVYRFDEDYSFAPYYFENASSINLRETLKFGQPYIVYFFYRQSPRYFEPKQSANVTESDPPLTAANMANIKLDGRGRLVEFVAVPPPTDSASNSNKSAPGWNALFTEAGLDISKFNETEPRWTPPVFADERRAWQGAMTDFPDLPLRVETAAFQGKPVYFRTVAPWDALARETEASEMISAKIGYILIISIVCLVILGSIFLARRNLLAGRGDLKGGLKLTIFIFAAHFAGVIIYADHVPSVWGELSIIYQTTSHSLIIAVVVGLMYIALEPFVRRYWSELLISWNRLLQGDFRDPMIGRDILIGGLFGVGHTASIYLGMLFVILIIGQDDRINGAYHIQALNGIPGTIRAVTGLTTNVVTNGFVIIFVLLGFYLLTRRKRLSVFLVAFLYFAIQSLFFVLTQHWGFVFPTILVSIFLYLAISRFGLLCVISYFLFFNLNYLLPITFDTSSFFFPSTIAAFALTFALAVYAFYISIAGQPIFGQGILREVD
ncbi:MAG TPA: serine/threonine-protein kinase [Pyrinomonadaceae bacterium]|nr:serine/threonine-protein kinase [Pyrinomonadaceae bacterium]